MTTNFATDPNTQTIAAAWASSPLGPLDYETGDPFDGETVAAAIAPSAKPNSIGKGAVLAAVLAAGIAGGAALGLALFDNPQRRNTAVL
jgi:hypothetical protein